MQTLVSTQTSLDVDARRGLNGQGAESLDVSLFLCMLCGEDIDCAPNSAKSFNLCNRLLNAQLLPERGQDNPGTAVRTDTGRLIGWMLKRVVGATFTLAVAGQSSRGT